MTDPKDNTWTFDHWRAICRNWSAESERKERAAEMLRELGFEPERFEELGYRNGCLIPRPGDKA